MKGKIYSISFGMLFKRYYCADCGTKLKTEKTHRIVTKDDPDYYRYHDVGQFPRVDYEVYDQRFQCPSCGRRTAYDEQCILNRIQKKLGTKILSPFEVKQHYEECSAAHNKSTLLKKILFPIAFSVLAFSLFVFTNPDLTMKDYIQDAALVFIATGGLICKAVGNHKGVINSKYLGTYSHEKRTQLERLHSYCTHNKRLVEASDKCYCFYCKSTMDARDIEEYIDSEQTALCPKCGIDAILPDRIDEPIDDNILSEMNTYWF